MNLSIFDNPTETVQRTNKKPSQAKRVLAFLRARGKHGVYNYEFFEQHILRAPSRVDELRKDGYNIKCEKIPKQTGVYRYILIPEGLSNEG